MFPGSHTGVVTVSMIHTSVPRRSEERERGEQAPARSTLVLAVGASSRAVAADAIAARELPEPGAIVSADALDAELLASARRALRDATVGVRIVIAAPEAEAYALRDLALGEGAVDAELVLQVTAAAQLRVYCAHCRTVASTERAVGERLDCPGCGAELLIYYHFSRRHAAYLGYMADAEEPHDSQERRRKERR